MKNLSLILFPILFLASVHSQMNNTWTFAWQNSPIGSLCIPQYITIASPDSINFNISYIYSSSVQVTNCPSDPINSSSLTQPNTSVLVYTDSLNNTITYTTTAPENIEFTLNNTNSTFFYLNSQDLISQPVTLGTMGAYWNSPSNASDDSDCTCVPDYVLVLPTSQDAPTLEYYSYYTTQPACAQNFSESLNLTTSTPSSISWVSASNITFTYTPTTVLNLTYTYFNSSAGVSCPYSYQRTVNTTGIIANGSWVPDWQDSLAANYSSYPSYYEIANVSNEYMTTTYTLNNQSYNSYLVQNSEGQYQDVYLNQSFTYDQPTNTFTVVPASTASPNFIYSQNGSLFNASEFIELWGTPQTSDDTSNCCVFSYVNITANSTNNNTLNVVYTPPEGYSDAASPCSDFATYYTSEGVLEGYLVIENPSITGLTWVDEVFNSTVAFAAGSNSTISVQFPSACPISMVVTAPPSPTPTPKPVPLSGSWISVKAVGLVMGLFVGIVCM